MKRFLVSICIIAMLVVGCAGINTGIGNLTNSTESLIANMTARRFGYSVGMNNPEAVDIIIAYCDAIKNADEGKLNLMLTVGIEYLAGKISSDPMMVRDLNDLLMVIGCNQITVDIKDPKLFLGIVTSFSEGVSISTSGK